MIAESKGRSRRPNSRRFGLTRVHAEVAVVIGAFGVDEDGARLRFRQANYVGEKSGGEKTFGVVGNDNSVAPGQFGGDPGCDLVCERTGQGIGFFLVDADHLLMLRHDACLGGGGARRVFDQECFDRGVVEYPAELGGIRVGAYDSGDGHGCTQSGKVGGGIGRAPRADAAALFSDDGDGSFRGETFAFPPPIAVEDNVAQDQETGGGEFVEQVVKRLHAEAAENTQVYRQSRPKENCSSAMRTSWLRGRTPAFSKSC